VLIHVLRCLLGAVLLLFVNLGSAEATAAAIQDTSRGAVLFEQHCAGCHINGGNIIRRGKNLKLKTLERDDIATVEAIAAIAREGRGQMSGYAEVLGTDGDQLVAEWILLQAQKAWTQG
jgi:cytochrome c6